MDKKLLIGIGLAVVTGGAAVIALLAFKTVRKVKVNKRRKKLRKYVKQYLGNNKKALEIVDNLSNFQVRILFKIIEKTAEKVSEVKLPGKLSDKLAEIAEG